MDDEAIEMLAARDTYLVADIYDGDWIAEVGTEQGWDADVLRKNDETTLAQREGFAKCVEAGVKIAYGTDSGIYPHGFNARQFAYHVRWGQTPARCDPGGDGAGRRADGLGGPDRPHRDGLLRRPDRRRRQPARRRPAARGRAFVMKGGAVLRDETGHRAGHQVRIATSRDAGR